MAVDVVQAVFELAGGPWPTLDPFLFCVHHDDRYPRGNAAMGPAASLEGRELGADFAGKDGWRMYHGETVPGFPQHPHRGFETVTLVRRGLIDHADSLGATARFGHGDAQWLTAGAGINHSEMFPLLEREADNPLELFQIWLNLPAVDKLAEPHFAMLWREAIPTHAVRDAGGRETRVTVVAGRLGEAVPPAPPPRSWAARPEADLAIWTLQLDPGAGWTIPPARPGTDRMLYVFGGALEVAGRLVPPGAGARLHGGMEAPLRAGAVPVEALLLQARAIGEPVAQRGPFVMNQPHELQAAFADYRRTQFGGWPWPSSGPVHHRAQDRFARHADGTDEVPAPRAARGE